MCTVGKRQASCPAARVTRDRSLFRFFQHYTISLTHLLPCYHLHHRAYYSSLVFKRLLVEYSQRLSINLQEMVNSFFPFSDPQAKPQRTRRPLPSLLLSYGPHHCKSVHSGIEEILPYKESSATTNLLNIPADK